MTSANIILTYRCVNRCAYCFSAETYEGTSSAVLSGEEFAYYLDLLKRSERRDVRLLGGEPFTHPDIEGLLRAVLDDPWFEHLTLFTAGFVPPRLIPLLENTRVNLVVNVNQPSDYPAGRYRLLTSRLRELANRGVQLTVGMNIYRDDFDYPPVVRLAQELGCTAMRWSLAMPSEADTQHLDFDGRVRTADRLIAFLEACVEADLEPVMDCPIEHCMFTDAQLGRFARLVPQAFAKVGKCAPVLDLGPGHRVLRCFATGDALATDAREFETLQAIVAHYEDSAEHLRPAAAAERCRSCPSLRRGLCYGGCIGETASRLTAAMQASSSVEALLLQCRSLYAENRHPEAIELLRPYAEQAPVPALIAELANALLHAGDEEAFGSLMERHRALLTPRRLPGTDLLWARYHSLRGDRSAALGRLRRCLHTAQPSRRDGLRAMILAMEDAEQAPAQVPSQPPRRLPAAVH